MFNRVPAKCLKRKVARNPNPQKIQQCPYCKVANPTLLSVYNNSDSFGRPGGEHIRWILFRCNGCNGRILYSAPADTLEPELYLPGIVEISDALPERARIFLRQAIDSVHAPSGSVMLTASCLDAMLKDKGYTEVSIYKRIDQAVKDHLLTQEMARWAHDIRLDANDARHADLSMPLATVADAERCIEFAKVLADILYVIPAKVKRGIESAGSNS